MKQVWQLDELIDFFTLSPDDLVWLASRTPQHQLGLAVYFKIFQYQGRFPETSQAIPHDIITHIAIQLQVDVATFTDYDWTGRSASRDRQTIYQRLSYHVATTEDGDALTIWMSEHPMLRQDQRMETLLELAYDYCREHRLDPPSPSRLRRIIRSGVTRYETQFFDTVFANLPAATKLALDNLLYVDSDLKFLDDDQTILGWLKQDAGQASVVSIQETAERLRRLQAIHLPPNLFDHTTYRVIQMYARRLASERPYEIRRRAAPMRYTLLAAYCCLRQQEITDQLVELFIQVVQKINTRAERRIDQKLIGEIQRQRSEDIIVRLLQTAHDHPKGIIEEVLYPIASPQELKHLIKKQKTTSRRSYERQVYYVIRASYQYHYRTILPILLDVLQFVSKSQSTMIEAIQLVQHYMTSRRHFYPLDENIPLDGVIPNKWQAFVLETDTQDRQRVNRINYEVCMLQTLQDYVRSKAVWVVGARDYRNPDDDLPTDYEQQRDYYYSQLGLPLDADTFVDGLQQLMHKSMTELNQTIVNNPLVRLSERDGHWIHLTPLQAQPEPQFLDRLKAEIDRRWSSTSLLDILKETDLRIDFTKHFQSAATRETLSPAVKRKRILLCLYGLGTNVGLKPMAMAQLDETYDNLRYIKRRFISKEGLRDANTTVINLTLAIREPQIWGEGTTSCASDSRQFAAQGHNLRTEWRVRYHKKGVMIYWHVEKNSLAVYS